MRFLPSVQGRYKDTEGYEGENELQITYIVTIAASSHVTPFSLVGMTSSVSEASPSSRFT
jgi:hypothetical protein